MTAGRRLIVHRTYLLLVFMKRVRQTESPHWGEAEQERWANILRSHEPIMLLANKIAPHGQVGLWNLLPMCKCMSLNVLCRKMECHVLNPMHAQGTHLVQHHGTLKHNSHERGDQSFFCVCRFSYPGFSSQLSHSESDQRPDTDRKHHAMNLKGSANAHTLTHASKHLHKHFTLMSQTCSQTQN